MALISCPECEHTISDKDILGGFEAIHVLHADIR